MTVKGHCNGGHHDRKGYFDIDVDVDVDIDIGDATKK